MNAERRTRLIARARLIGDKAALAILEADRRWTPDPETPMLLSPWAGLRWTTAAAA